MNEVIAAPSPDLKDHAPKIVVININPDKIRDVIGPGGKMIKQIVAQTGVKIDIDDDGRVHISSPTQHQADEAIKIIRDLTAEAEVGATYKGIVKKIMDFGAFVEILPNTDGLVHISELAHHRVKAVTDILKEGDEVTVKVLEVDRQGKIRLSRKALLEAPEGSEEPRQQHHHHGKKSDRVSKKHSS
jgi:polyribonucleotide nucleotidyltransferase